MGIKTLILQLEEYVINPLFKGNKSKQKKNNPLHEKMELNHDMYIHKTNPLLKELELNDQEIHEKMIELYAKMGLDYVPFEGTIVEALALFDRNNIEIQEKMQKLIENQKEINILFNINPSVNNGIRKPLRLFSRVEYIYIPVQIVYPHASLETIKANQKEIDEKINEIRRRRENLDGNIENMPSL